MAHDENDGAGNTAALQPLLDQGVEAGEAVRIKAGEGQRGRRGSGAGEEGGKEQEERGEAEARGHGEGPGERRQQQRSRVRAALQASLLSGGAKGRAMGGRRRLVGPRTERTFLRGGRGTPIR